MNVTCSPPGLCAAGFKFRSRCLVESLRGYKLQPRVSTLILVSRENGSAGIEQTVTSDSNWQPGAQVITRKDWSEIGTMLLVIQTGRAYGLKGGEINAVMYIDPFLPEAA